MAYDRYESMQDALHPSGLRKTLAMVLFFVTTTLPTVFLWQNPPKTPEPQAPLGLGAHGAFHGPGRQFGPRHFGPQYGSSFQAQPNRTWSLWNLASPVVQLSLATIGGAFSLALYYPRSGFKRLALLCGPFLGFGTMISLALYLAARTEVYRFEIVVVSMFGALPGLLLYLALVYWKVSRLQDEHVPIESAEPVQMAANYAPFTPPAPGSSYPPRTPYPPGLR